MLKIFLLGSFRVELDGKVLEEKVWERRKVKSLLKLLALQPAYRLHKDQALDLLWPDLDAKAASSNLYRTLHLLRQTLEPDSPSKNEDSYIIFKQENIRLNPVKGIWVDLEAFHKLLTQVGIGDPLPILEEALKLYQGDLLEEDPYEEWTILSREEARRAANQALLKLAEVYRQRKNYPQAIAQLQRILAKEATNENAHRELILTYTLAGQRSEALNQYQHCREVIAEELGLDPSPETLELYRLVLTGEIKADLPLPLTSATPTLLSELPLAVNQPSPDASLLQESLTFYNNLPASLTPLVGREDMVSQGIKLLLEDGRLLTLTGPGGAGKTRLALEIASCILEENRFAQGVCFVSLASLTDPDLLPLAIAQATGIREANGLPPLVFLKQKLREAQLLLVLDNFEQIIEAANLVSELLSACPKIKVLVTSRSVLHLYGEQELLVEPLSLPPSRSLLPLELLLQSPAITLFVQRARAVKTDFKLTLENAPAVSEICFQLDGLPLAIELVAAQVKLFSPQHILKRLDDWLHLVNRKTRDLPTRQQSLENVLEWSYDLLDQAEQNFLAQLGVFVHSFTLEAVEAICTFGTDHQHPKLSHTLEVVEQLSGLIDKSLLYRQELWLPNFQGEEKSEGITRFRMLELVREYALEKLQAGRSEEMVRERHLDYYLKMAEETEPQLHRLSMRDLLKRLELEHGNFRAALRWSLAENRENSVRLEKGIRLAAALAWFWHFRGYWSEGSVWLEKALALTQHEAISRSVQAKVWHAAGIINAGQGQARRAFEQLKQGLVLFQELDDKWGIAHSFDWMAELHRALGHYTEARPLYETAHQMCVELEDHFCANLEQIGLGYISFQQGDYTSALNFLRNSLETSRGLRDKFGAASALNGLGELFRREGDYEHALVYYRQSLSLYREMGLTGKVVMSLHNIGQLQLERQNFMEAESFFKSSLVLSYEIKSRGIVAFCMAGLACTAVGLGRLEEAARLFGAVESLLQSLNIQLDPSNQTSYNRNKQALQAVLSEPVWESACIEGANLPLEQLVSTVLNQGVFSFEL
jgi:predicted ATPase/DNA-binding SARP family transcriptional activator